MGKQEHGYFQTVKFSTWKDRKTEGRTRRRWSNKLFHIKCTDKAPNHNFHSQHFILRSPLKVGIRSITEPFQTAKTVRTPVSSDSKILATDKIGRGRGGQEGEERSTRSTFCSLTVDSSSLWYFSYASASSTNKLESERNNSRPLKWSGC